MKKFRIKNLMALYNNRMAVKDAFYAGRAYTVFRVEGPDWARYAKDTSVTYGQRVATTRQAPADLIAA